MSPHTDRDASTDRLLKAVLRPELAPAGPDCLDGEQLAAWVDGVIYGEDALKLESHVAECPRCQALMAAFAQSEPADATPMSAPAEPVDAPAAPLPFRPRRGMRWFIPLTVGTAAAILLVWTAVGRRPGVTAPDASVARLEPAVSTAPQAAPAGAAELASKTQPAGAPPPAKPSAPPPAAAETLVAARPVTESPKLKPAPAPGQPQPPPPPLLSTPPTATMTVASSSAATNALTAPPPPTVTGLSTRGAAGGAVAADNARADAKAQMLAQGIESLEVTFSSPAINPRRDTQTAGQSGGAGGGRGGAGGMRTAAQAAAQQVRWLVSKSGSILRSVTDGATWEAVTVDPTATITGGVAPSASVCWLIGRAGAVMRSADGFTFTRVKFPEAVDLRTITAVDDKAATVTTSDGRTYKTNDGGQTWQKGSL